MKSKRIVKTYKTLRQAERYQNLLYNKFDSVKLVRSPMFTEYGIYAWEVSGEIAPKRNPQPKKKNAGSTFPKSLGGTMELPRTFVNIVTSNERGEKVIFALAELVKRKAVILPVIANMHKAGLTENYSVGCSVFG
jgi:hypothetical protein